MVGGFEFRRFGAGRGNYPEKDFDKAKQLARKTGKPLLLDFTASWRKPCQIMEKEFWGREDVIEAMKPFVAVKLDYDNETGLARKYGASAIPYVVFADPLGNLITFRRGFGSKSAGDLSQILDEMPKNFEILLPAYDALDANKEDGAPLLKIADAYR